MEEGLRSAGSTLLVSTPPAGRGPLLDAAVLDIVDGLIAFDPVGPLVVADAVRARPPRPVAPASHLAVAEPDIPIDAPLGIGLAVAHLGRLSTA